MGHKEVLTQFASLCRNILQGKYVGVYLHGSLAMGCYQYGRSDIDILVIVNSPITKQEKKHLIHQLMSLEADYQVQFEMSVIDKAVLFPFQFPTPFELHYSVYHKYHYENEEDYLCDQGTDKDVAAHLVVTLHRGMTVDGPNMEEVIPTIDDKYFICSIKNDIQTAKTAIIQSPVYYVLNLCRALFYVQEGVVASKQEGGIWAMQMVADHWKPLIQQALEHYQRNLTTPNWNQENLVYFATYMLKKIDFM